MLEEFRGLSDIDLSALKLEFGVVCKGAAVNTFENIFRMKRRFSFEQHGIRTLEAFIKQCHTAL